MAAKKFIRLVSGIWTEVYGIVTSAGASNDGDLVALDATGKLDASVLPAGVGADVVVIQASENLAAGDWVNIYNSSGAKVRKADAATNKPAHGFVLSAVTSGNNASVYCDGSNGQVTGKTPGARQYLSASTPGLSAETPPTTSGHIVQYLGMASSSTNISSQIESPITLA